MRSLFLTVCLFACIAAVLSGDDRLPRNDQFMEDLKVCKEKVGAKEEDVELVTNRKKLNSKASCLMACIKKKSGAMTADNKIDMQKAKAIIEPMKSQNEEMYNKMLKMLEACKQQETTEADECIAAKKFSDCMIEQRSKS